MSGLTSLSTAYAERDNAFKKALGALGYGGFAYLVEEGDPRNRIQPIYC